MTETGERTAPTLHEQPAGEWEQLGEPLAEAAVLGCVLRGTSAQAHALLGQLTDDDWTVPAHAHVAAAARALLEQGQPVDPVTVLGQLRRSGTENARTANRDTAVLLVELCQAAPCNQHAGHYLQVMLEHSYRRRAQQAAVRLLQAADHSSLEALHALIQHEHDALGRHHHRITAGHPTKPLSRAARQPDRTSHLETPCPTPDPT